MKARAPAVLALALWSGVAAGQAPDVSLRPQARPGAEAAQVVDPAPAPTMQRERKGLFQSLRPKKRSKETERQAKARDAERAKGAVCGDLDIQGVVVGPVPGRIAGCGIENAVKVRAVSGLPLSQEALMDCTTAKALKSWVDNGVKPAVGSLGGGPKSLYVMAHYICRTRNNQPGGKISEHGKGRAIDIGGIRLQDDSRILVAMDWNKGQKGRALKQMHRAACGPFGTVLGPDGDRFHQDHFHMDTARYRSGSYCR